MIDTRAASPSDRIGIVRGIAEVTAGPAAAAVDRDGRFPREAVDALKKARMLSVYVPAALGGAGAWLGIATDAVSRARAFVRGLARQTPGTTPPAAARLSEASTLLQTMRSIVGDMTRRYEDATARADGGAGELSSVSFAIQVNDLKLATSRLVVDVVTQALRVCGVAGYRNDSPFSVTRHLRDAHSAALMISNDRIHAASGALHLVYKDDDPREPWSVRD